MHVHHTAQETARAPSAPPRITGKYLSLTSYRRDGAGVATPVWFVADDDRLLVMTTAGSGKVKRIRRNPFVTVAACSARGRLLDRSVEASAWILPPSEVDRVTRLMERKYRIDLILIRPIRALQPFVHPERRNEVTAIVAITPSTS